LKKKLAGGGMEDSIIILAPFAPFCDICNMTSDASISKTNFGGLARYVVRRTDDILLGAP
jgi:hypothetical protein